MFFIISEKNEERMNFHIGELIRDRAKLLRIGPTELGAKIETSKQNVYGIFKRRSIDTELLSKICKALEHDFFADISDFLHQKKADQNAAAISEPKLASDANLQTELAYLISNNLLIVENNGHLKAEINNLKR